MTETNLAVQIRYGLSRVAYGAMCDKEHFFLEVADPFKKRYIHDRSSMESPRIIGLALRTTMAVPVKSFTWENPSVSRKSIPK